MAVRMDFLCCRQSPASSPPPYCRNKSSTCGMVERTKPKFKSALAAESILALARRRLVTIEEVSAVLSRLTSVQRPTGIIALAALGDERVALNAAPTSIDRMRVQWAIEHL